MILRIALDYCINHADEGPRGRMFLIPVLSARFHDGTAAEFAIPLSLLDSSRCTDHLRTSGAYFRRQVTEGHIHTSYNCCSLVSLGQG